MIDQSTISALSFDLDDTLYDNVVVIRKAESSLLDWLSEYVPLEELHLFDWASLKKELLEQAPSLDQDVSEWRRRTIAAVLINFGQSKQESEKISEEAMTFFVRERSLVDVKPETHDVLSQLQNYYPMVAISNGNLDLDQAGISKYFKFIYKANVLLPKKPSPKMFQVACQDLKIEPSQLLHIGDHWVHDVQGSHSAGCQAAWLSTKIFDDEKYNVWQIKNLSDLLFLIPSSPSSE